MNQVNISNPAAEQNQEKFDIVIKNTAIKNIAIDIVESTVEMLKEAEMFTSVQLNKIHKNLIKERKLKYSLQIMHLNKIYTNFIKERKL